MAVLTKQSVTFERGAYGEAFVVNDAALTRVRLLGTVTCRPGFVAFRLPEALRPSHPLVLVIAAQRLPSGVAWLLVDPDGSVTPAVFPVTRVAVDRTGQIAGPASDPMSFYLDAASWEV